MRVVIIREDNAVIVDGFRLEIGAVSLLPANVHAVQWNGDTKRGELEFSYMQCPTCGHGSKQPNAAMTEFKIGDTSLQPIMDAWTAAKAAHDAEMKRIADEAAAKQEPPADATAGQ